MAVQRWSGADARSLRLALRMTVQGFAEHVGVSPRTVSKWEQRRESIEPLPELQAALDTVLKRADDDARLRFERAGEPAVPSHDESVRRRELLQVLAGTTVGAVVAEPAELARRRLQNLGGGDGGARDEDAWEELVSSYAAQVGALPPAEMLRQLQVDVNELTAVLPARVGANAQLMSSAGQLAAMIAICSVAEGATASAGRWWRTALGLAAEAGDAPLVTFVGGQRALMAAYSGLGDDAAVRLADGVLAADSGAATAGRAAALAARAQGLAALGRASDAQTALHDLEDLVHRMPDAPATRSWFGYAETKLRHVQSLVHSRTGNEQAAEHARADALALYPPGATRGRTQVELHRAVRLARSGGFSEAARHATAVLQSAGSAVPRDRLVTQVADEVVALTPQRERTQPDVVELRQLIARGIAS